MYTLSAPEDFFPPAGPVAPSLFESSPTSEEWLEKSGAEFLAEHSSVVLAGLHTLGGFHHSFLQF